MKTRWLVIAGVLVFLYTLVLHAPLALLHARFRPANAPVELVGVAGTLGQGSAAGLLLRGQTAVRDLQWRFRPGQLLLARAAFDVSAAGDGLLLDGRLALLPNGGVDLSDLRISGPLQPLLAATRLFLPLDGALGLELDTLQLRDGFLRRAQGRLALSGLAWKLGQDPLALGDFEAQIAPRGESLSAQIRSLSGPLEVSGEAELKPDRSYDLHLQLRAKADAPSPLVNMLRSLGQPDNQAFYHLRRRGQLTAPAIEAVQEVSE